jgi:2,4-dienoyl-CoA reductase-like NADH-dependent reductase (Old Yellow Enzyme family)/thioredoxin reductase
MVESVYRHLFEPIRLGTLEVKNRIMMTNHGTAAGATPRGLRYIEERARGGVGLMCVSGLNTGVSQISPAPGLFDSSAPIEFDSVQPDPTTPSGIAYYDDRVIPEFREVARVVHQYGAIAISQIFHLGSSPTAEYLLPSIGPSSYVDEEYRKVPHVLDTDEIERLVLAYGHAARRGREAGLDGVEIHAAHGYLVNQFLSPYTNRRTDAYGGSFENRLRLLEEILGSVDRLAGRDFPVGLRINGDERAEGGLGPADVASIASAFRDRLMYVNISGGTTTGRRDGISLAYASPWLEPLGYNVESAATIRGLTPVPVVATGRIIYPEQAEVILAEGQADMIGMARALFADPQWARKAEAGRAEDIRPCIGTLECHAFREGGRAVGLRCAVNPTVGREVELEITPVASPRRILVVGGGPAGIYAATYAAQRGHAVVLCDREGQLGGAARMMGSDPTHTQLRSFLAYLRRDLDKAGVEVRLQTTVTRELVEHEGYDVVIVATGARPKLPELPGVELPHVTTGTSVMDGSATVGQRVLVVAGLESHLQPLSVADVLAHKGHDVELVCEAMRVGDGVEPRTLHQMIKRLLMRDVRLSPMTQVCAVESDGVVTRNVMTRRPGRIGSVDTVVFASAAEAVDDLARVLKASGVETHTIGDALAPRRLVHAILEGARIGVQV